MTKSIPEYKRSPMVFTPLNEPYLGLKSLLWFDRIIIWALSANEMAATYTQNNRSNLTSLQKAACQIIPQGISIALSIRELLRQGYLFPAMVLIRPLIERAAIISYLDLNPNDVALWEAGWKHGRRPSLKTMLEAMAGTKVNIGATQDVCDAHNHIVHGDPIASYYNLVHLSDGRLGYACGKIIDQSETCDNIAMETQCYLIILGSRIGTIFPKIQLPSMDDNELCQ